MKGKSRNEKATPQIVSRSDPASSGRLLSTVVLLFILAAATFLLLLPLFHAPFERDQGAYATIARGWMNGALPYRDLWDNKGPLLFLWYAVSFRFLGETIAAPRIAAALAAALSVPFVWGAAFRLFGSREARLATIFYTLSFANVYLQVTANAEVFMLLPLAAGFWAFSMGMKKSSPGWYLLAGICTAWAVFTRQSAIMTFLGYGAWIGGVWMLKPDCRRSQGIALAAMAGGTVLGSLPFIIYFKMHGALYELWFAMFGFNISWVAGQSFWLKFVPPLFIEPGPLAGGLIFWIMACAGAWILWKRNDRAGWIVLSFLVASEAAAQVMGKGSAHYSIQLLPAAAIAAAFGWPLIWQWWQSGKRSLRWILAFSLAVTTAAVLFAYLQPTAKDRFVVQYTFRDYADDAVRAPAIGKAVADLSEPGRCVYEWGRSSQIYFLADRRPCSHWLYNRPYEVNPSMADEVMRDLRKNKPAVIFVTAEIPPPPALASFIEAGYVYAGEVEYAQLYREKSSQSNPNRSNTED